MAAPRTTGDRLRRTGSRALAVAGAAALEGARRLAARRGQPDLQGDRWVEWSFCFARMADGPGATLDFGADIGFLSLAAAQRGHEVLALDRMPSALDYSHPRVTHLQADILERPLGDRRFDQVLNCSSVEHVGLAGRYGSEANADGDLEAMRILRKLLAPGGRMILTIPVGRDLVCAPLHRIYGHERLPLLLDGYATVEQQFWCRDAAGRSWHQADRDVALATQGSEAFYALGLFVLGDDGE